MKLIASKSYGTTLLKLTVVFICLIVSNCQILCQSLVSKDSLVVITKAAAEKRLIELKDYRVTKQIINQYQITDSIQRAVIKNDSLKFSFDKKEIQLKDSLFFNQALISSNNEQTYLIANKEVSKQKRIKVVSWAVSAALAVLLIIKK